MTCFSVLLRRYISQYLESGKESQLLMLEKKYLKGISSILAIAVFVLLNCFGCKAQVLQQTDTTKVNQYRVGKKDGLWRIYYQAGQLKTEGSYKADLKEGLHKEWANDGILLLEGLYENGKANGLMKWYHEGGHLAAEGNMKADIRVGDWKICDIEENGFCIAAHFKNGERDGVWKINHAHARDKLWKEQTWKEDRLVGEKCWDDNGNSIECE